MAQNGPDRTESWVPVGRAPVALGVERLLTTREVAARLHVCRATIYSMVERGDIPHVRIGNAVRFELADLVAALERHRHK